MGRSPVLSREQLSIHRTDLHVGDQPCSASRVGKLLQLHSGCGCLRGAPAGTRFSQNAEQIAVVGCSGRRPPCSFVCQWLLAHTRALVSGGSAVRAGGVHGAGLLPAGALSRLGFWGLGGGRGWLLSGPARPCSSQQCSSGHTAGLSVIGSQRLCPRPVLWRQGAVEGSGRS